MTENLLWRLCLATRDDKVQFHPVAIPAWRTALPGYATPPEQRAP